MASLTTTAFANALRVLYPGGLEVLVHDSCPIFSWFPRDTKFKGASKAIQIRYSGINGSNTFSVALAGKSVPSYAKFVITRAKTYAIGSIDNEALQASVGMDGAAAEALKDGIEAAMEEFNIAARHQLWHTTGGARGQAAASGGVSTDTITLATASDAINFSKGMILQMDTVDGTGTVHDGTVTVSAVDTDAGTITCTGNVTTGIASAANSDYIFRYGDYGNCLTGVQGWIPASAPTAGDSHFSFDRSNDPVKLAGARYDATGMSLEEGLTKALAHGRNSTGSKYDAIWMNPLRVGELSDSMTSKTYVDVKVGNYTFAASQIAVRGPYGLVPVMEDPGCPYGYAYPLTRSSWVLSSLGPAPQFSDEYGLKYIAEATADAIEFRLKAYWQLICRRPYNNMSIDL